MREVLRLGQITRPPHTPPHYPPGTSKWNKVEHKLFSLASMNWKGRPLVTHEAVVDLIGDTRTRTGLKVKVVLGTNAYETGHKVADHEMNALRLEHHTFHGDWNYTLLPGISV